MRVSKCKWKYNSKSPVMFMIDDLANKYIKLTDSTDTVKGCDWGAKGFEKNSFWSILNDEILNQFPYVKVTMFLVVGRREPIINKGNNFYSEKLDESDNFKNFINNLSKNDKVELAYHGYTHGICSNDIYKFKEEWETFKSVDMALENIEKGKSLFENVIGKSFKGGKYCGYKYNEFSDESIVKSNFLWWCRHWDGQLFFQKNDVLSFELEEFDGVVDIPSTIDGSFYSLKNWRKLFTKKYLKSIYVMLKKKITLEKQINYLINNKQIISIQEHTAPYRVDDRIQYPNIVSDKENLRYIFNYLKKYNLWYATGTEIAEYYKLFNETNIKYYDNKLSIEYDGELKNRELTIKLECENADEVYLYNADEEIKLVKTTANEFIGEIKVKSNKEYNIKTVKK